MSISFYDQFSTDYDRFVNWESRLAYELPFLEAQLTASNARRVLDVACGTGMHAIALAQRGYEVTGVDASIGMIEKARSNAVATGSAVNWVVAGFGEIAVHVSNSFDALLCLGNSLPHVLDATDLERTLADFRACLRPGGLLLVQNRNFDAVLNQRNRWMPPETYKELDSEWLFIRFYDFEADGSLTFNILTLRRKGNSAWQQTVRATRLWPLRQPDMAVALDIAGFEEIQYYGDMQGAPFAPDSSPNLIVTARRLIS